MLKKLENMPNNFRMEIASSDKVTVHLGTITKYLIYLIKYTKDMFKNK